MDFVNVREFKLHTSQVLKRIDRRGWAILLKRGKPAAAIIPLNEDDIEDVVFRSPKFLKELKASYAEYRRKGGMTLEEARKKLGL